MGQWDFSFLLIQTFKKYRKREKSFKRKTDKIKRKFDLSLRKSPICPFDFFCIDGSLGKIQREFGEKHLNIFKV